MRQIAFIILLTLPFWSKAQMSEEGIVKVSEPQKDSTFLIGVWRPSSSINQINKTDTISFRKRKTGKINDLKILANGEIQQFQAQRICIKKKEKWVMMQTTDWVSIGRWLNKDNLTVALGVQNVSLTVIRKSKDEILFVANN